MRPVWTAIPIEFVRALATGNDAARLLRLTLTRQARFAPHAFVTLTDQGFIAVASYDEFGRSSRLETAVKLSVPPNENALPAPGRVA